MSQKSTFNFSLKNLDGSVFKMYEHIGKKVILIDFWATWCKPCKKMLKKINVLYRKYQDDICVLAISVDDSSAFSNVESYVKGKQFSFTVLLDPDNSVSRIFNPSLKIPYSVLLNREGKIVYSHSGYLPGFEKELERIILQSIEK
jgi:peroxiredoxin